MYMNHLVAAFALFVLALLGGLLPLAMREVLCMSEVGRAALLSVGACFSGGLLVGASLLHLLPEATELDAIVAGRHGLRRLHGGDERPFPASFLLCAAALLCMIAAEFWDMSLFGQEFHISFSTSDTERRNLLLKIL